MRRYGAGVGIAVGMLRPMNRVGTAVRVGTNVGVGMRVGVTRAAIAIDGCSIGVVNTDVQNAAAMTRLMSKRIIILQSI